MRKLSLLVSTRVLPVLAAAGVVTVGKLSKSERGERFPDPVNNDLDELDFGVVRPTYSCDELYLVRWDTERELFSERPDAEGELFSERPDVEGELFSERPDTEGELFLETVSG